MTKFACFIASCFLATVPLVSLRAAANPPPVIERAPEADSAKREQDIAELRATNERILIQLRDAQWELAEAKTRIDELTASNAAEAPEKAQLAAEKARAEEANTRLATLVAGVDKLTTEKTSLESRLAEATKAQADLRQQLANAQKAVVPARPTIPPETVAKLAEVERKLTETQGRLSTAENKLSEAQSQFADNETRRTQAQTQLAAEKATLESRLAALSKTEVDLRQQLVAAQKAATPPPPTVPPEMVAKLADTERKLTETQSKLSATQSSLTDAQKKLADNETKLAQAQNQLGGEKTALESRLTAASKTEAELRQQLVAAQKAAAPSPPTVPPEMVAKLADTERKLTETQSKLSATQSSLTDAQKKLADNETKLAQAQNQLGGEKTALESRLATASKTEAELRQQLAASQKAATPPPLTVSPELVAKLADTERKLTETQNKLSTAESGLTEARKKLTDNETKLAQAQNQLGGNDTKFSEVRSQLNTAQSKAAEAEKKFTDLSQRTSALQAENELLNRAASSHAGTSAELDKLRQEKAAFETRLAEANSSANANITSASSEDLKNRLTQTEGKLETVLRSFSLLQTENEKLKSNATSNSELASQLEAVRKEKAALEASIAANPTDQSHHLATRLAEVEDRLSTTLRSYTLLQRENDRLKADAGQIADAAHTAAARSANENANQISALFDELRQTQARATALSAENSQLKTRLALVGSPPGSTLSAPSRPGSAQAIAAMAPAAASQPPEPAAAEPAARTHVVVSGDTLGKISRQYYGTPGRWDEILRANSDVIKNENVLTVGATLRIP